MFLTWSQPNDIGLGGVLSYKVSYRDISGTLFNMVNCTILSHDVTDLTPNTTYTMTVMADNGISGNEENRSVSVNVTTNAIDPNTTTGMLTERCNVYNTYKYTPMLTHRYITCGGGIGGDVVHGRSDDSGTGGGGAGGNEEA